VAPRRSYPRARKREYCNAEEFAIHVKGLEISAHDPRAFHSAAVAYATGNRGGCHLQGGTYWAEGSVAIPELGWEIPFNRFGTEGKGEMLALDERRTENGKICL